MIEEIPVYLFTGFMDSGKTSLARMFVKYISKVAASVTFLGFKCKYPDSKQIPHKSWIHIIAKIQVEFAMEYKGKGPVLISRLPSFSLIYFMLFPHPS